MNKTRYFIGGVGEKFCRRLFPIRPGAARLTVKIVADRHRYSRESWLPLRGDGADGNWLIGGSFVKFRLFFDGREFGLGPLRQADDTMRCEHVFPLDLNAAAAGTHVLALMLRGEELGAALEWRVDYLDGTAQRFDSGDGFLELDAEKIYRPVCWEAAWLYNFFKGDPGPGEYFEHIDGNRVAVDWMLPGYSPDAEWTPCRPAAASVPVAAAEYNYQYEAIAPQRIEKLGDGHYLIDFGREAIGGLRLAGPAAGGAVEVRLGEELLQPDRVRYQMRTGNCYQERWNFRPGRQKLQHFGLRIFRYAELLGYHDALPPEAIAHWSVRAPFDDAAAQFSTSDPKLQRLWDFCKYSIKATGMDLFTDCFSRERIAYEADSYITMRTGFAVGGGVAIARRTLEYLLGHHTWPCEWYQMMIPLFHEFYYHTGDRDFLARHFDTLVKQSAFVELCQQALPVRKFPYEIIIDWPPPTRDGYVIDETGCTVPNCLIHHNFRLLEELAGHLGREADRKRFAALAAAMREAIQRECFDVDRGIYRDSAGSNHATLHANFWALWCGVVPEEQVETVLDFVEAQGMNCSLFSAQFLLDVLFRYGRPEAALKLMLDEKQFWFAMLDDGATVTTETWLGDGGKNNMSRAHPWGASPANLIVRHLWGLRPLEPGWKTYEARPRREFLGRAELRLTTPGGVIVLNID